LPHDVRRNTVAAAASDYWCKTALRRWIAVQLFSTIVIDRKGISRDNNPVTAVVEQLDRGRSVIIFPEGGRTDGPEIGQLKGGLYHIARKRPEVEMVPAFIHNANRVLPKGMHIPVPLICSVNFGQPIKLTPGENKDEFVARARSELEKCRVA
jgi:1-acyl-sn-glycerol-3-phosphate acyltransferase